MKNLFVIGLIFTALRLSSQDQLKNTFSSWHEMHGGMEDSGTERTESYVFVAKKKVKIKDIYFQDKEIELKANDSIQINIHLFTPYNSLVADKGIKQNDPELKKRFNVVKKNHTYYANAVYPYNWPKKLEYTYKKKKYSVIAKEKFDTGNSDYAP